jgi:hypothetical protein
VHDVIRYSSPELADLQPGDRIIEYAGSRVLTTPELTALTGSGSAEAQAGVCIADGEQLDLYVPHGPLGIRPGPDRATRQGLAAGHPAPGYTH